MNKQVINPRTNRLITIGGPTHRRLIDEGVLPDVIIQTSPNRNSRSPHKDNVYNLLPKEMLNEIIYNTPIESIGVLCHVDQRFLEKCYDKNFWITYIGGDQEKLHNLLIELAKQGDWTLFDFLWRTPLLKKERTKSGKVVYTEMIKEFRSLLEGYRQARLNGKEGTAEQIWSTNSKIFDEHHEKEGYGAIEKDRLKLHIDLTIDLCVAAQLNNISIYKDVYREIIRAKEFPEWAEVEMVAESAGYAASYEMFRFIIILLGDDYHHGLNMTLQRGSVEYINKLIDDNIIIGEEVPWLSLLRSPHPDPLKIIKRYIPEIKEVLPNTVPYLQLGNPDILTEYAHKHHNDPDLNKVLRRSYKALPAEELVQLYKDTVKCVSREEVKENVKHWQMDGYDYLAILFEKEMPICR